jgi:hypothetical protein
MSGELPPWDGGPDRVLPVEAKVLPTQFTVKLMKEFDHPCGPRVAVGLHDGVIWVLAGGQATVSKTDGHAVIALWLPYWLDRRMDRPDEHVPIDREDRWRGVELAFGVLARAWPGMAAEFGFLGPDRKGHAWPWFQWPYGEPPEYVLAWWPREEEELDDVTEEWLGKEE